MLALVSNVFGRTANAVAHDAGEPVPGGVVEPSDHRWSTRDERPTPAHHRPLLLWRAGRMATGLACSVTHSSSQALHVMISRRWPTVAARNRPALISRSRKRGPRLRYAAASDRFSHGDGVGVAGGSAGRCVS